MMIYAEVVHVRPLTVQEAHIMKTISDAKCRLFVAGIIGVVSLALCLGGCTSAQAPTQAPSFVATSESPTPTPTPTPTYPPASSPADLSPADYANWQTIIDSINPDLKSDEAELVQAYFSQPSFLQNLEHVNVPYLTDRLSTLKFKYKAYAAGFNEKGIYARTEGSTIYVYGGKDLSTAAAKYRKLGIPGILDHELGHITGEIDVAVTQGDGNSVKEGITDSLTVSQFGIKFRHEYYDTDRIMAKILFELFGDEIIRAAYFDLSGTNSDVGALYVYVMNSSSSLEGTGVIDAVNKLTGDIQAMGATKKSQPFLDDITNMDFLSGQQDNELLRLYVAIITGKNLPPEIKLKSGEKVVDVNIDYWSTVNPDNTPYYSDVTDSVGVLIQDKSGKMRTVTVPLPNRAQWLELHP